MLDIKSFLEESKKRKSEEKWLIRAHHIMMKEYGWIPFEEFKKMPLPTMMNLLNEIDEDFKAQRKEMEKMKNKRRR